MNGARISREGSRIRAWGIPTGPAIALTVATFWLVVPTLGCANGQPYVLGHYAPNGNVPDGSLGAEGGFVGRNGDLLCMAGLGGTLASDDDAEHEGVDIDNEGELYGGVGFGMEPGLLLFATGGFWFRDFDDDDPDATEGFDTLATGGLHLRVLVSRFVLSIGVHSERGLVLGFGSVFGDLESVSSTFR